MSQIARLSTLRPSGWVVLVVGLVIAVCTPVFIIAANVSYVTHSEWLYAYNWWRNGIADRTGLPTSELDSAAVQIKDYFRNDADRLQVTVISSRGPLEIFDEREILHMIDVKVLMQGVDALSLWLGVLLVLLVAIGFALRRGRFFSALSTTLRWSAAIWGVIVLVLVVASLIDFTWVFTQFHLLSFANDLWQLDPFRHYLLLLFPERFFLEATLFIALLSVVQFAGLYVGVRLMELKLSGDQS